ncbi:MAG: hypothetical protein ACRC7R_03820 [Sarcina sp.]
MAVVKGKKQERSSSYILGLYLGISSIFGGISYFLVGLASGIVGIILGIIAIKKHNEGKKPLVLSLIGFTLSFVTLVILMIVPLQV